MLARRKKIAGIYADEQMLARIASWKWMNAEGLLTKVWQNRIAAQSRCCVAYTEAYHILFVSLLSRSFVCGVYSPVHQYTSHGPADVSM